MAGPVLVTGASGFVGRHLCGRLCDSGNEVHAVSRTARPSTEAITWHQLELSDTDGVRALLAKLEPDVVFHLASEVTGDRAVSAVLPTFRSNLLGTVSLMVAAVESRCARVVHAGSMEEQGGVEGVPGSGYAAAKLSATEYSRMFHATYGLSVVNLRLFMVYGPDQPDETKVVPYTIRSLLSGVSPALGSGERPVDWVYVSDVVDAFLAGGSALTGDDGAPIDVGSGTVVTIREMVELIAAEVAAQAKPNFGARPDRAHEAVRCADLSRASEHLGWSPRTSLADGVARTVAWYSGSR
jgi:nucleoside-diphosphate-sugar epimerase